jgi:hypothetical protein
MFRVPEGSSGVLNGLPVGRLAMLGTDVRAILQAAVERGFSLIPVGEDKRPAMATWKPYQERRPTREELVAWWLQDPPAWGVVTGTISGIVVVDFDGEAGMALVHELEVTPHVLTPRGAHLYLEHPGWKVPTVCGRQKCEFGPRFQNLDIRGDGGLAVLAGRSTFGFYQWVREIEPDPAGVLPEELRKILGLLHPPDSGNKNGNGHTVESFLQRVSSERLLEQALDTARSGRGRNEAGFLLALQLRDNGFPYGEAEDVMRKYGAGVPPRNPRGALEPYSDSEATNSLRQAYSRSARSPWGTTVRHVNGGAPPSASEGDSDLPSSPRLPVIIVNNRDLRDIVSGTLEALRQANDPPSLFVRSGRIVTVSQDEHGRSSIVEVSESSLRGRMARVADYRRTVPDKDGGTRLVPVNPPLDAVRDVLSLDAMEWRLPSLEAVSESPFLRPDGTVVDRPGYDPATRVCFSPSPDLRLPRIADEPIGEDIAAARAVLDDAIGDFPFACAASKANALALLLTPVVRRAIRGQVPLALIDAPQPGVGKSLLAEIFAIIHSGLGAAMRPAPGCEEEWRKSLGAVLLAGYPLVIFDNANSKVDSPALALALTATTWSDRILGESRIVTVPQEAVWAITGNNLRASTDIVRRSYWIRLDARSSQPWQRTGFRHPDLKQWVRENRGDLVGALLTLARAWYASGKPEADVPTLGSFEAWTRTVGGILAHAGVTGFLRNLEDLHEQSDISQAQWEAFLTVLHDWRDREPFTALEVIQEMEDSAFSAPAKMEIRVDRSGYPGLFSDCPCREAVLMWAQRGKFRGSVSAVYGMALALMLTNTAFAQSSTGGVRGSVRDQTNAVIPGARLQLTNQATNVVVSAESNEAGLYVFPSVIPGRYNLTVEFAGMETLRVAVEVQVQVSTTFHAVLKPGGTETKITVSAEVAPLLVADNPSLGHVLERQRIEQLPLNGRDLQQLLVTVPGLEVPRFGDDTVWTHVRSWGMMAGAHQYILDGAVLEESMWNQGTAVRPPGLETIQEFKVENNSSSAKYTRMTSIIMSTKSGTNQLHGAVFETNRDNAYGKARSRTDFGAFPDLHRNEYGGNLGGPVFLPKLYNGKNRTFFFTAYEGFRIDTPGSRSASVPTAAMRNGDFSGLVDSQGRLTTIYDPSTTNTQSWSRQPFNYGGKLNAIDRRRISPLAKYAFSVIPQPTFPERNPLLEANWFGPAPNIAKEFTYTERLDHRFRENDHTYGRFNYGGRNKTYSLGCPPTLDKVACLWNDDNRNWSVALNWVHTFSPTLFNEITGSYADVSRVQHTGEFGVNYIDRLGLPNPFKQTGFPYIQNVGFSPTNYLAPTNYFEEQHGYWIVDDNATKIVGKHELEFGVHLRWDRLNTVPQLVGNTGYVDFATGATALYDSSSSRTAPLAAPYTGNNTANLFLGVANYQARLRKGMFHLRRPEHAIYFQDNIKVTPRFTLNLGVRWQFSPFVSSADGVTIPGFNQAKHAIVLSQPLETLYAKGITLPSVIRAYQNIGVKFETWDQAGVPRKMANNNWRDWGPHLGAAYRVGDGARSFVIRGGFSKSYFNDGIWTWMDQSGGATPFSANFLNYALTDPSQSPDGIGAYGMRSVPTIVAGANSANAVSVESPSAITPGSTYNYYFNTHMPTDYVYDWNVTVEKEIMANTVLRFGYVGNHSGNQIQAYSYNDSMPAYIWYVTQGTPLPTGTYANVARRPYDNTTYGEVNEYRKSGWSNYSGAQFVWERRYSKGFSYQLTYVVGNAFRAGDFNSGGGYTSPVPEVNQFMPGAVPADYDQRNRFLNYRRDISFPKHRVRWNWMLDLPFGQGKPIGRSARGVLNQVIGGWQLAGLGNIGSTYATLTTGYWNFTGQPLRQYGYQYPIEDCRSGTCYPGYLWYNGYIPANQINSVGANGRPNGVMGVPADYKPAVLPLIPWGSTELPPNAPAGTNVASFWDTNTVWIPLKDGTLQRTTYGTNLNPWRNQYIPGPLQWVQDVSLYKRFRIREGMDVRFNFDAFNVFNHPNNGSGVGATGILDVRGQSNKSRELQLAIRLSW